jgi:predicted thioesterase
MNDKQTLRIGDIRVETFSVTEKHTAYHIGSGDSRVLSTPSMISFMEQVSNRLLASTLSEGTLSVGMHVDVRHLSPTPVGSTVRVRAELLDIERNRYLFQVTAWDQGGKIGEGTHRRAVVQWETFQKTAAEKRG